MLFGISQSCDSKTDLPICFISHFLKGFIDLVKVLYEHSIANSRVLRCVTHDGTVSLSLFGIFCYVTKHLVLTNV